MKFEIYFKVKQNQSLTNTFPWHAQFQAMHFCMPAVVQATDSKIGITYPMYADL